MDSNQEDWDEWEEARQASSEDSVVYAAPTDQIFHVNLRVLLPGMSEFKWDNLSNARNEVYKEFDLCVHIFKAKLGVGSSSMEVCGNMYLTSDSRALNNSTVRNALKSRITCKKVI